VAQAECHSTEVAPFTSDDVRAVLDSVRPYFERDGGGIELVAVEGCNVRVRLYGACTTCASSAISLQHGVERRLREELPGFGELFADSSAERSAPRRWWQFLG
jgi:Fe-S cluster biogenesis protein NfuA